MENYSVCSCNLDALNHNFNYDTVLAVNEKLELNKLILKEWQKIQGSCFTLANKRDDEK